MKNFIIGLIIVAIVGGLSWYFLRSNNSAPVETTDNTYTLVQIAQHNNQSSCWTTINGGVYDLTNWISQHPGGPARILSICGKDGSAAFNAQHGGQTRPAEMLVTFKIGVLAQ